MREERWPAVLAGAGLLLGLDIVVRVVALVVFAVSVPVAAMAAGVITSTPFLVGIVYGGYRLAAGDLPPERYRRAAGWCFGGVGAFVALNVVIMLLTPSAVLVELSGAAGSLWLFSGWLRWAAGVGGSAGLLAGLLEAGAIERETALERKRVRQEELERRNERLEEFASIVSHDLRGPLSVADGRLKLARDDADSEHLRAVADAHDRMNEIIEDTLALARQGQVVETTERTRLGEAVTAARQGVDTGDATVEVVEDLTILADPDRLRTILENLLRNAVDHAGEDATVRVGALPGGFYVEDDGPGIDPEDRGAVLETGYSTAEDGVGLGLAIVDRVAEAHGWSVAVTDGTAGGARFEFTDVETD